MCFIVCHQCGIFGLGSKEKGLYLHAIAYEGGTGFGETGWGKLEAAKKVTWAQLSKHWIALSITIQSMSTRKKKLCYPVDSELSGGWCYPTFEQPGLATFS